MWVEVWFWVKGTCLFPRRRQKGFNRQILYQFDRRIQSRDSATRAIQRLARVSDPYPLPLEKPYL